MWGVNECVALAIVFGDYRLLAHINVSKAFADYADSHEHMIYPEAKDLAPNPEIMIDELMSKVIVNHCPVKGGVNNNYTILIAGGDRSLTLIDTVTELVLAKCRKHILSFDETRVTKVFRPFDYIEGETEPFVDVLINKDRDIEFASP